jgi:hypothetical protein
MVTMTWMTSTPACMPNMPASVMKLPQNPINRKMILPLCLGSISCRSLTWQHSQYQIYSPCSKGKLTCSETRRPILANRDEARHTVLHFASRTILPQRLFSLLEIDGYTTSRCGCSYFENLVRYSICFTQMLSRNANPPTTVDNSPNMQRALQHFGIPRGPCLPTISM